MRTFSFLAVVIVLIAHLSACTEDSDPEPSNLILPPITELPQVDKVEPLVPKEDISKIPYEIRGLVKKIKDRTAALLSGCSPEERREYIDTAGDRTRHPAHREGHGQGLRPPATGRD